MIRLKYILFKKFEKSTDARFPAYLSLYYTECLPTLWSNELCLLLISYMEEREMYQILIQIFIVSFKLHISQF